ncbi:Initiator Replication protein [Rubrimonas cliftonensis]|uniref:Initiator Replication protein n=2 Tax=Rubrimonas cliftonensis TaxID=89524 RepID=A0A1H4FY34_9RHOB|nr:Initiator Replication protein [Rubrimonas cliftonensis]
MGDPDRPRGALTYAFDKRLAPLLRESTVFGKLELEVMRAFSTKYALALYEAVARRVRLSQVFSEDFSLEAFRDLLGVADGRLATYSNLKLKAITPAVLEVNALASFGCKVEPRKTGRMVTGVRLSWWRKSVGEMKEAYAEIRRPRVGRKARVRKSVETVTIPHPLLPL